MPRHRTDLPRLTGSQLNEMLQRLHGHKQSASQAVVRGLRINRSTLSRWRRHRGLLPAEGLAAEILARLHHRLAKATAAERRRFEIRLDWGLCHDDELAVLSALLWVAGAPLFPEG